MECYDLFFMEIEPSKFIKEPSMHNWTCFYGYHSFLPFVNRLVLVTFPIITQVFKECHMSDNKGSSFELSLVGCKCIGAYVRNKKNQNQVIKVFLFLQSSLFQVI